jgi:hypothetical protein
MFGAELWQSKLEAAGFRVIRETYVLVVYPPPRRPR